SRLPNLTSRYPSCLLKSHRIPLLHKTAASADVQPRACRQHRLQHLIQGRASVRRSVVRDFPAKPPETVGLIQETQMVARGWTISKRLYAGFGALLLLTVLAGVVAI